jgi:hypothetical protein
MLMVFVFQDVSSSRRTAAGSKTKVHRGPSNMEVEVPKNARITNFFRIHKQYSDDSYFLGFLTLKCLLYSIYDMVCVFT